MTSYRGHHAELYDVFYADKPYQQEAEFVHGLLHTYGKRKQGKLLELACGTGSHALAYEKLGYEVTALDHSEDMLAVARAKATAAGSSVTFLRADMRSMPLDGTRFDAAVCLFDSIGYVQTNEAITEVFRGVYRNLHDQGLFIFEFWHAAAMLAKFDPVRVRRFTMPDREILRIAETKLLCERQVAEVRYDIYELKGDGTFSNLREMQHNRYFLVQEMRSMLTSCGFRPLKFFAGFSLQEDVDENTWHVLTVAARCPGQESHTELA
jgi:ubiquinone/menaquinone biosynthesis C-methylase UbiE